MSTEITDGRYSSKGECQVDAILERQRLFELTDLCTYKNGGLIFRIEKYSFVQVFFLSVQFLSVSCLSKKIQRYIGFGN